jgi:TonB family protein
LTGSKVSLVGPRGWAFLGSFALHVAITVALVFSLRPPAVHSPGAESPAPGELPTGPIAIEPPAMGEAIAQADTPPDPVGVPPRITAGDVVPRPDTAARGHAGDSTSRAAALNLADVDERLRLSPDLLSRVDRDQIQRIRVGRVRAAWEDRRATTHPAELTFVSTGPGAVRERRPSAARDPARGALDAPGPRTPGAAPGRVHLLDDDRGEADGRRGAVAGTAAEGPGLGLPNGLPGPDHRASARLGTARPSVTAAAVSVPAPARDRPQDNVDSEQEVATTIRSLVQASTAGGAPGEGEGGSAGGLGAGAAGLRGEGSTARPLGLGEGDVYDYWTSDPRLLPYFRAIHGRIDPLWAHAFPKSALLDLKQGTVILDFTVFADGRVFVAWPPVRPSGIDEFDRNCADAIRRASPFGPIPRELGVSSLRIRAPFVASNPIVK